MGTAMHPTYFTLRQDKETKEVEVMLRTSNIVDASMCGFTRNNNTQERTGFVEAISSEEAKKLFLELLRSGTGLIFG